MSCLKLYWPQVLSLYTPDETAWADEVEGPAQPVILSFPRKGTRGGGTQRGLLERARMIHANRECPICCRTAVVPVDAEPALLSRNNMPVPGTSHLIGFECNSCGHTWDVGS